MKLAVQQVEHFLADSQGVLYSWQCDMTGLHRRVGDLPNLPGWFYSCSHRRGLVFSHMSAMRYFVF